MLTEAGYDVDLVGSHQEGGWDTDHEGHSGWRTHDIDDNLGDWLAGYTPDIVLIHLGTNDAGTTVFSEEGYTMADSLQAMTSIVEKLRADNASVRIYLAQILPTFGDESDEPVNDFVDDWNIELAAFAQAQTTADSPIEIVDMNMGFGEQDMDDGCTRARKEPRRWRSCGQTPSLVTAEPERPLLAVVNGTKTVHPTSAVLPSSPPILLSPIL